MRRQAVTAVATTLTLLSATSADVVKIPIGDQGANPLQATYLVRGSSAQRVAAAYGKPVRVKGPVGEPPITAWEYDQYTVYFERDRLLHIVAHHRPAAP